MNVIVDSYRIFSVDNDGNTDFSFLAFDILFESSRMTERILIFSLIGLYLGLKSHKDINTNFISKYLLGNSNPT